MYLFERRRKVEGTEGTEKRKKIHLMNLNHSYPYNI